MSGKSLLEEDWPIMKTATKMNRDVKQIYMLMMDPQTLAMRYQRDRCMEALYCLENLMYVGCGRLKR